MISASLGKGRHIQLSQPIRLILKHLQTDNVTNPSCVFWNYIDQYVANDTFPHYSEFYSNPLLFFFFFFFTKKKKTVHGPRMDAISNKQIELIQFACAII